MIKPDITNSRSLELCLEQRDILIEALKEIFKGQGRYSKDPQRHADNTIAEMKGLARQALKRIGIVMFQPEDLVSFIEPEKEDHGKWFEVIEVYNDTLTIQWVNTQAKPPIRTEKASLFQLESICNHETRLRKT